MIGIFDSGSGGLTVLRAIKEKLPSSDILYYGDIKNAPYGEKAREELSRLTIQALEFLQKNGATSIVSACNSVSASLAVSLFDAFNIAPQHLIEMVGPTVAFFRNSPSRLILCATPATISSGIYQNAFTMIRKEVTTVPISGLAGAIEFGESVEKQESLIREAFKNIDLSNFDALILACTHYPLAETAFRDVLGDKIHLFDPAEAVAERVEKQFWPREAGNKSMRFVITKESPQFRSHIEEMFSDDEFELEVLE
jgi:glutamate racemase